ncbi:MAG: DUF2721 domain-containing protein [Planctomycetota bacterium]
MLISACGLMIMALNARAMTSKSRIRQLHIERLALSEKANDVGHATMTQRLRYEGVGNQSTNLLHRLKLMRAALMCMVGTVVLMLASSIFIGLSTTPIGKPAEIFAVITFISGILCMLAGAVTFLLELRISLKEITYEHDRMMGLRLPDEEGEGENHACSGQN